MCKEICLLRESKSALDFQVGMYKRMIKKKSNKIISFNSSAHTSMFKNKKHLLLKAKFTLTQISYYLYRFAASSKHRREIVEVGHSFNIT